MEPAYTTPAASTGEEYTAPSAWKLHCTSPGSSVFSELAEIEEGFAGRSRTRGGGVGVSAGTATGVESGVDFGVGTAGLTIVGAGVSPGRPGVVAGGVATGTWGVGDALLGSGVGEADANGAWVRAEDGGDRALACQPPVSRRHCTPTEKRGNKAEEPQAAVSLDYLCYGQSSLSRNLRTLALKGSLS